MRSSARRPVCGRRRQAGIWVVDPIDGTQPFVSGMTSWCVSIAFRGRRASSVRARLQSRRRTSFSPAARDRATLNGAPIALASRRSAHRRRSSASAIRPASARRASWASCTRLLTRRRHVLPQRLGRARPLLRRLRPAARLCRAAHQFLGLPGRDGRDRRGRRAVQRLPGR